MTICARPSADVLAEWVDPVWLVHVDGKHDVASADADLGWGRHLGPGGVLLLHDAFSSVGVTLAVLLRILPGTRLAYERRVGSLAVLRARRPTAVDRIRVLTELPWFARNVVVKILLRLRLRAFAARLGHDDEADPY